LEQPEGVKRCIAIANPRVKEKNIVVYYLFYIRFFIGATSEKCTIDAQIHEDVGSSSSREMRTWQQEIISSSLI
jgi:hypothetical protein